MAEIHRALIALDAAGAPRVLATDSRAILGDIEEIGTTDADDLDIVSTRKVGPGLWLWEGTIGFYPTGNNYESEVQYKGELRAVTSMVAALDLFTMKAPEPEYPDDDRETAEA